MKKKYIMPTIEEIEVEVSTIIAMSEAETENENSSENNGTGDDLANSRRGSWGNLWD